MTPFCDEENRGLKRSDNKPLITPVASGRARTKICGSTRDSAYNLKDIEGLSMYWPLLAGFIKDYGYFVLAS